MPVPRLSTALDTLMTRLQAINGAGAYTTDVATVEMRARDWNLVSAAQRPFIGIYVEREEYEHMPARQVFADAAVHLICLLPKDSSAVDRKTQQLEMVDDLFEAVNVDTTLGGIVIRSNFIATEFDCSDINSENAMRAVLSIRYRRSTRGE